MTAVKKKSQTSPDQKIAFYKEMLFYRRFEERVNMAYTQQKFSGFCHLHIGQEAVCVGVGAHLRADDYFISGYRSHTQAINKGIPAEQVFAELLGKETGCARGKGGSMHMFSKEKRFFGGHGIVGGQAPIAVGVGFKIKYQQGDEVMVCCLGDAAMNQGQVFEALNMAATWSLPVLFLIENNRYGMGTDIHRTTSIKNLYERALAFNMNHSQIDGMDVLKVYDHVGPIIAQMRLDKKPYLLEAMTYRFKGHSVSDPATYRTKEEMTSFQQKDPLLQLSRHLQEKALASEEELRAWDKEAKNAVKESERKAEEGPVPDVAEAWTDVYA